MYAKQDLFAKESLNMLDNLSWANIHNNDSDRLEFGAHHVNMGWRRHTSSNTKFAGLRSAFADSPHRLPVLLQNVGANVNARNHPERGQAVFAAVWSAHGQWAILCDVRHATLVFKARLECIPQTKEVDKAIGNYLRELMDSASEDLRCALDGAFATRFIG